MDKQKLLVDYGKLKDYLIQLDSKLTKPLNLIAFGGTSLTLLGLKDTSEDIDLIVDAKKEIRDMVKEFLIKKFKGNVDICPQGKIIPFYKLPSDYLKRSTKIEALNKPLKNIKLYAMDPLDVLVSKIGRFNDRDEEDARRVISERGYSLIEIHSRFGLYLAGYLKNKADLLENLGDFDRFYEYEFGK